MTIPEEILEAQRKLENRRRESGILTASTLFPDDAPRTQCLPLRSPIDAQLDRQTSVLPRRCKVLDTRHPRHQLTFDQVAAWNVQEEINGTAPAIDDIGYMANFTVHANMPYRDLPGQNEFTRKANDFWITLMAPSHIGLPYGLLPRIVIPYLTTEAVETKSPIIRLGRSRSDLMQKLGIHPTGGKNGNINRFTEMMKRIIAAHFSVTYDNGKTWKFRQTSIFAGGDFMYDNKQQWQCDVQLNQQFYENVVCRPVPFRWSTVNALRQWVKSALAIDLYIWSTYRVFGLDRPLPISFKKLRLQLGVDYPDNARGRYDFEREVTEKLAKVCALYRNLRVVVQKGKGITLLPSPTSVPPGSTNFRLIE